MLDLGTLKIGLVVDEGSATNQLTKFNQEIKNTENSITKTGDKLKSIGGKMSNVGKELSTKLTLPIAALGTASVVMASDFEESLNKVNVTFGDSATEVEEWSKTSLKSMGMAQGTALEMSALFGDMGQGMGLKCEKERGV